MVQSIIDVRSQDIEEAIDKFKECRISSAGLWVALEGLVEKDVLTPAERREMFWNAHSPKSQLLLARQEPQFDPRHDLWGADKTEIRAADSALSYTMKVSHFDQKLYDTRVSHYDKLTGYSPLLFAILFSAGRASWAARNVSYARLGGFVAVCVLAMAYFWHAYRAKFAAFDNSRSEVMSTWLNECSMKEVKLKSTFADPNRLLETPIAKVQRKQSTDCRLWLQLDDLVRRGLLSRAERRQFFYNSLAQDREALLRQCSFYCPQDPIWSAENKVLIDQLDSLLTQRAQGSDKCDTNIVRLVLMLPLLIPLLEILWGDNHILKGVVLVMLGGTATEILLFHRRRWLSGMTSKLNTLLISSA